ncbi:MAG: S1 RNA-binding domain-containing protein [Patescibacteria group bacterium]|nr:S1 RNA-binding domain-containing protein [Patescibacteria group bacterium]
MTEETKNNNNQGPVNPDDMKFDEASKENFQKLLDKENTSIPAAGDIVKGTVLAASKAEVKLDIGGVATGVVRGRELYFEAEEYAKLKPGDEVEATIIEEENENGELELSFRSAGQLKAWNTLVDAFENRKILKVKINDANKGGLLVSFAQIQGFLPVSQLAPENYPRVNGGDKGKILDKLKSFVGTDFEVKVMALDQKEEKLVVSEKEAWQEKQKDIISQYKVGSIVTGSVTALTDFGVFLSFGENLEGLIHISELAWQRIDDPADLFKVGDKIKAEIISIEGSKIFLSAKKLLADPWHDVDKKYQVGQTVGGTILKVNPFGLFVELDKDIHGLSHISQLGLKPGQKISETFKMGEKRDFTVVSIEPREHRLGLAIIEKGEGAAKAAETPAIAPAEQTEEKKPKVKKAKKEKSAATGVKSAPGGSASGGKEKAESAGTKHKAEKKKKDK